MSYKVMRLKKYYDAIRTNKPFLNASVRQKLRISLNIFRYFKSNKNLVIKNKPVTAQIEPTSCCNLKCSFCIRDKIGVPIGTMSFEDFKKILAQLDCLFKIHLSGQGESFINKDLFKMIRYANQKGILVNLNTNGTLLTKDIIKNICETYIGEIAISIESTKKNEYEGLRRGAKYDVVMENIQNLNKQLKKHRKGTILSFAVTILKKNILEIPEFVKLAKKVGITKIIIQTIQEKEDYVSKYEKDAKSQVVSDSEEKIKEKIGEARLLAKKYNIDLIFDEEKSNGCLWPWRGIYVTWNGYVTGCCKILDYRNPVMGNLLNQKFWDVWNGKNYQLFRQLLRKGEAPLPCRGCKIV